MSILGSNMLAGAAGRAKYEIERSLRFNSGDAAYLNRTPGSAGNRRTFTFSCWCKRSKLGIDATLFSAATNTDNFFKFAFKDDNRFEINTYENGDSTQMFTTAVFRDVTSWYHIVVAFDTTQATAANRVKLYVNGTQVTAFDNNTLPPQNRETVANATGEHQVGNQINNTRYFDGYIAEVNQVDGLQLGPESFGQTELETGAWIPRQYNGSYGTNGFYLKFADNSGVTATTLGKDSSGNSNNFTPQDLSVTAGAGNDSLEDTPTNNWCTFNSLEPTSGTFSNGNLNWALNAGRGSRGTFFNSTGKWYFEATLTAGTFPGYFAPGIQRISGSLGYYGGTNQIPDGYGYIGYAGAKLSDTTQTSYGDTFTTNDVIGVAYDLDAGKVWFSKNGTWQASGDPAAGANPAFSSITAGEYAPYISNLTTSNNDHTGVVNFGQRAFAYTPPTGFKALNAKNLPAPTIKDGTKNFNTVLYTGNSSTQSITGVGFKPDWVWIKGRGSATYNNHILIDVVRGVGKLVQTNVTVAEAAAATTITSFDSDGFSLGAFEDVNTNNNTYAAWNWKAGGAASNNFDGSTTGLVSANPEAGFSIVGYTGTGSETTVGHGLGVTPGMIWVKNRDANEGWIIDSRLATGNANGTLHFNTDTEYTGGTNQFGTHSSSIFTVKTSGNINTNGQKYVAYVFAEVEGFSKFGTYTGNGSSGSNGNGPYVHCGFRPAFIIIKVNNSAYNWYMYDSTRNTYNAGTYVLFPNLTATESQSTDHFDWLSNGFKVRGDSTSPSGTTVFFMAFAERPFKYANAV